jgi:FAD/FMN-containing dehydrogenase
VDIFVPRGWFLPVTPGTKFVTVGGAVASDVHGKNHHLAGSFSSHVRRLKIMLASGEVVQCGPDERPELFAATCGGMGLTGVILEAAFALKRIASAYISQETVRASCLDDAMDLFEEYADRTYSVAWIDCLSRGRGLGRSVLMAGEHASVEESGSGEPLRLRRRRRLSVPVDMPGFVLGRASVKAFNALYYAKAPRKRTRNVVELDSFFYPLDAIHDWNRIYGRKGFTQYQFVIPKEAGREGMRKVLEMIAGSGQGSFLAVLKLFGRQDSLVSFPMEGYTLALDFKIRPGVFGLLDELDRAVLDHGGRLYLTKDARMPREAFDRGYGGAERFRELKASFDPEGKFESLQSRRLGI